jgi:Rrf2 family protein
MALGQLFSQRFGYAIHALAYMAKKPPETLTTLPELAGWMRTVWPSASEAYLSNVIQRLARGGVLRSHRGVAGGYSLARSPDKITLRDVTEVIDGVSQDQCSLSLTAACPVEGLCSIQNILHNIEEQHLLALQRVNFSEIAAQLTVKCTANTPV